MAYDNGVPIRLDMNYQPNPPAPHPTYTGFGQTGPVGPIASRGGVPAGPTGPQVGRGTPAGPVGPQSPLITTPPPHSDLSYQAAVATAVAPLMKQLASEGQMGGINKALSGAPFSANADTANPSLASGIASSIHNQVQDYQWGLKKMLQNVSTAQPLSDLLKGIGGLISYPVALPGQQSIPDAVQSSPILQSIYDTLNSMRNYGGTGTGTTSSATPGYNQSVANLVGQ